MLNDTSTHAPPFTGLYHYNTWTPAHTSFPAAGGSYTDPVFNEIVRRVDNVYQVSTQNCNDIYAMHWANADGTLMFTNRFEGGNCNNNGLYVTKISDGTVSYSSRPFGTYTYEIHWDMIEPLQYYYLSLSSLVRHNLSTNTSTLMKNFGATLEANGGSMNIQDSSGRYFTVRYDGTNKVWDSQTDTVYTGTVTPIDSGGWIKMTADGKYLINAASNFQTCSHAINHATSTLSSTGIMFWGLSGDHSDNVCASDGKSYQIMGEAFGPEGGIWRVDVSLNQSGQSIAAQKAANFQLIDTGFTLDQHYSGISRGTFQDWCFIALELLAADDPFDGTSSAWVPWAQEIVAVNVLTAETRRFAHHRSRGLGPQYGPFPRISCAPNGSAVMWASNFNVSSFTNYADMYAIENPLGVSTSATILGERIVTFGSSRVRVVLT